MAAGNEMRVGDAEREAAAAELREHYASGRLTLDELNERVDKAFAAKTRGDLNTVMTDLPSARPGWSGAGTAGASGTSQPGGSFGPSGPFGPSGALGAGSGWGGSRAAGSARAAGSVLVGMLVVAALFAVGIIGAFGVGPGRPFGIVLLLAAFALLRRLIFRSRGGRRTGGCGPRGRRRW